MNQHFSHRLPFGAECLDNGQVRFRLWAPAQTEIKLVVGRSPARPMERAGDGWFEALVTCGAGTHYRYQLADGTQVPDPAARAQAGDVHDASVVVDPCAYQWRNASWQGRPWTEAVMYELHVGTLGGFRGVIRELPRLSALGVTAIELMPVNDFPGQRNWGYDGVLPYAPDAAYGSPDDLKALVDAAHDHGLMIFLDVVYNHFGPEGNYLGRYAPQFFCADGSTPWGPAIDFRRPEVRRFFTENTLYWLMEYRFDGLRFDAVHAIPEPDWLDETAATIRATVEPGRRVHLVLENGHNAAAHLRGGFDAQWNDDGHHAIHVLLSGQIDGYYVDYADQPAAQLARALAEGFVFQGQFSHYFGRPRGESSRDLPPTAFVLFLQNHDQVGNRAFGERLSALCQDQAVEAAIALQILCPQIPLIFMGEEAASPTPFLFFTDHPPNLAAAVREGRRQEFARFPAFTDATARARIPDPNAVETFEASVPLFGAPKAETRAALYRRLLEIRHTALIPRLEGTVSLGAEPIGPAAVVARWRMGDGSVLTLAVNLGETPELVGELAGTELFATSEVAHHHAQAGVLEPHSTILLLKN